VRDLAARDDQKTTTPKTRCVCITGHALRARAHTPMRNHVHRHIHAEEHTHAHPALAHANTRAHLHTPTYVAWLDCIPVWRAFNECTHAHTHTLKYTTKNTSNSLGVILFWVPVHSDPSFHTLNTKQKHRTRTGCLLESGFISMLSTLKGVQSTYNEVIPVFRNTPQIFAKMVCGSHVFFVHTHAQSKTNFMAAACLVVA